MSKKRKNRIFILTYCMITAFVLSLCFVSLRNGIINIENSIDRTINTLTYIFMIIIISGLFESFFIQITTSRLMGLNLLNSIVDFGKQNSSNPASSNDFFTGLILVIVWENFSVLYSETKFHVFLIFRNIFFIVFIISMVISIISMYFVIKEKALNSTKMKFFKTSIQPMIIELLLLLVTNPYVVGMIYKNIYASKNNLLLIIIFIIMLCYFLAMSFCQFSNIYYFIAIYFDKKDKARNREKIDILKQWNDNRRQALVKEINNIDKNAEEKNLFKRCSKLFHFGVYSIKSFFQARAYIVSYFFLLFGQFTNNLFGELLEENHIRKNTIRFLAIVAVAELLLLDMLLFTYLGGDNSCSRFFELISTVVIIPILLSALLNLKNPKHNTI